MVTFYQIHGVCRLSGLTPRALHDYGKIQLRVPTGSPAGTGCTSDYPSARSSAFGTPGEAWIQYLAATPATDPAWRRALESAIEITEAQLVLVREPMQQLGWLLRR